MTFLYPDNYYHIYNHAIGSEIIFREDENYSFFLRRYKQFIAPIADTYCYCLMPNHFHLLIKIRGEEELKITFPKFQTLEKLGDAMEKHQVSEKLISKQFANLFSSYTQAVNKRYNRRGSLFIKNFKRKKIDSNSYFTKIIHYIHANPAHHRFVKNIDEWKWSSYNQILDNNSDFLNINEVLEWFGGAKNFKDIHLQPIEVKVKKLMEE